MKRLRPVLLGAAVAGIFLVPNPLPPEMSREWHEVLFTFGGIAALVMAVADSFLFAALGGWVIFQWYTHRTPDAFSFMVFLIGGLGFYALARRTESTRIIKTTGVLMTIAIGLQAAGVYDQMMEWLLPSWDRIVYNEARPLSGLTASSGDAGAILAMAVPYFAAGRAIMLLPLVILALAATKATSAILGGLAGLLVVFFPVVRGKLRGIRAEYGTGVVCAVLVIAGGFVSVVINRLDPLWEMLTDQRWRVWKHGLSQLDMTGHGLGSWKRMFPLVENAGKLDYWQQAHFDLLQFAFEAGIVGAALATAFLVESGACAYMTGRRAALGALAALAVCQAGHFPLHLGSAGAVACLVLAEARKGEA